MAPKDDRSLREWLRDRVIDDLETDFVKLVQERDKALLDEVIARATVCVANMRIVDSERAKGADDVLALLVSIREERRR